MLRICSSIVFLLFIGYNFIYVLAAPLEHRALGVRRHHKESKKKRYFEGSGTHYDTSAGVGSCGEFDSNDDSVVALNSAEMNNGPNPNTNKLCGTWIDIDGEKGSTKAKVVDTCPGCPIDSIDMSPSVYTVVCGELPFGVCKIRWDFI